MTHIEFMKLFAHLPQYAQDRIELAYILSKDAHRSQVRKEGERYFEHPRRAALILALELGIMDPDDVCVLLLHDTVEDTLYINQRKLELWFNPTVADHVMLVTKRPKGEENQRQYYTRIGDSPRGTIHKGCDRLDNLRSLEHCEPEFVRKQLIGTKKFVMPMLEHTRITSSRYGDYAAKLMDLMRPLIAKLDKKYKDDMTMVPCDSGMHSKGNEPLKPKYRFMCDECEQEYKEDPEAFK